MIRPFCRIPVIIVNNSDRIKNQYEKSVISFVGNGCGIVRVIRDIVFYE